MDNKNNNKNNHSMVTRSKKKNGEDIYIDNDN